MHRGRAIAVVGCVLAARPALAAFMQQPPPLPLSKRPAAPAAERSGARGHRSGPARNARLEAAAAGGVEAPARTGVGHGVEDKSASAQALNQWYTDAGAETVLKLAHFGEMRGMMATREIEAGDELLSYPREVTMDMSRLTDCPCTSFVDGAYWKSCLWFVQLGLWLLAEEAKGSASAWAPYIASLPRSLSRPVDWTEGQLDMLAAVYPPIVKDIKQQRREFKQILAATRPRLVNQDEPDIDRLEWAMHIALSRTFHSSGGYGDSAPEHRDAAQAGPAWRSNKVLVPTQDLINHNSHASPKYSYDGDRDRFVLSSDADYAAGQQVYNNYGQVSNDILLQCYGFVELDNPADTFCLQNLTAWLEWKAHKHHRSSDTDTAARLKRLEHLNLTTHLNDAHLTMENVDCVSLPTKQALRAFLASDQDLAELREEGGSEAPMTADDFCAPLNPENEMTMFEMLLEHVIDTQRAMPGSLQADTKMLSGDGEGDGGMSEEERTAVLFRREKRKVIAHARERLEHNTEMKWLK